MSGVVPVVVVHHGAPAWCAATVDGLLGSTGVQLRILVVDNSGDLDPATLPSSVEIHRPGSNLGYAGGANVGVTKLLAAAPEATVVAVCSHDCLPLPTTFQALTAALDRDPALGIVGPRLDAEPLSVGGEWNGWTATNRPPTEEDPAVLPLDWVSGTCLVARVACLRDTRGFDAGFGSYVEDVDLCLRARDHGWTVACVTGTAVRALGSASPRRSRLAARNSMLLVAKRDGVGAGRRAVLRYAWRVTRSTLGWLALHRPPERRATARSYAVANAGAVAEVVLGRQISRYARHPDEHVPEVVPARAQHEGCAPSSE